MKATYFLICLMISCNYSCAQVKEFHVKDYGSIGDGSKDTRVALQNCLNDALANNGVMVIDYGKYKISKALYAYLKRGSKITIKGAVNAKGQLPKLITDSLESLIVFESNPNNPAGTVEVQMVELVGNNVPYSTTHPYFGKHDVYASGIAAFNVKEVIIRNIIVRDIYGEGINVRNWNYSKNTLKNRSTKVDISNNKVLNCWGANPPMPGKKGPFDEYGDGIYVGNAINFIIRNNQIINDLKITRQFGRAGIVVEDLCENGVIEDNIVNGYDRGMHFEADLGGYTIMRNRFTGSDFGICIWSIMASPNNKPISIIENYFSNENIPAQNGLIRVRNQSERAFISFYTKNDSRRGSIIKKNRFYMSSQSGISGKAFMKVYQKGVVFDSNIFNNASKRQVEIYYDQPPSKINGEQYTNVNILFKKGISDFLKTNNKLVNSKSNISL